MVEPALIFPVGGPEVWLRPIDRADAEAMVPYFSSPEVCRFIPWEPRDIEGVLGFIDEKVTAVIPTEDSQHIILGIEARGLGLIGQANFTLKSSRDRSGEFGYVINPAFSGRGLATTGVSLFVDFLFNVADLRRLTARIDSRNSKSIALAQRLGMRLEATEVEVELFKGEWVTMHSFALLRKHWRA
ncbi:MAG: hypothetical protein RI917_64 [Actinomycetota bacterium]|jgi:RimJ/RimL family protein N-acetyltransferase